MFTNPFQILLYYNYFKLASSCEFTILNILNVYNSIFWIHFTKSIKLAAVRNCNTLDVKILFRDKIMSTDTLLWSIPFCKKYITPMILYCFQKKTIWKKITLRSQNNFVGALRWREDHFLKISDKCLEVDKRSFSRNPSVYYNVFR